MTAICRDNIPTEETPAGYTRLRAETVAKLADISPYIAAQIAAGKRPFKRGKRIDPDAMRARNEEIISRRLQGASLKNLSREFGLSTTRLSGLFKELPSARRKMVQEHVDGLRRAEADRLYREAMEKWKRDQPR
jgi:hypothetical protein